MKAFTYILAALFGFLGMMAPVAYADCPSNVQKLSVDERSPCTGWLVRESTMQEIARNKEELEKSQKLILAQEHLQKLTQEEVEHYKKRSSDLRDELKKSETQKFWATAGAFALGVVLTGIAAKAAIESTR